MLTVNAGVSKLSEGVNNVTIKVKSGLAGIMSLTTQSGGSSPIPSGVQCATLNQDFTSVGVGARSGYRLFTITSTDKLEVICENDNEATYILERLFSSSLVAIVGSTAPRKLRVCHFKKQSEICTYSYPNTILTVKLNRQRLVVCLEESLYIHSIKDMKLAHIIRDTPPNPLGICALCPCVTGDNCFLAYPGSSTVGQIQIFHAEHLQAKCRISAHDSPLAALCFNENGTKIATASEKGTVIRVFNSFTGEKLHELRRGMKRCATIYSLAFSTDSTYLACSSNTETVHIFKLVEAPDPEVSQPEEQLGLLSYLSRAVTASSSYLPTPVTGIFNPERAFATITLPFQGIRNSSAVAMFDHEPKVLVASTDGFLYIYNLPAEGGDCRLEKQHKLTDCGSDDSGTEPSNIPAANPSYPGSAQLASSPGSSNSYARALKGVAASPQMTDAERISEMADACESLEKDELKLNDKDEYPPMGVP